MDIGEIEIFFKKTEKIQNAEKGEAKKRSMQGDKLGVI